MAQATLVEASSQPVRRHASTGGWVGRLARHSHVFALLLATLATGCLPPAGGPLTVWAVDGRDLLAADTPPTLEGELFSATRGRIELVAAINETVAFQLGLRTTAPLGGPYQVEVSDLVGPQGRLPAESTVSLFRVHPIRVEHFRSWYPGHAGRSATPISVPDILVPWAAPRGGGPVLLNGPENEIIWVDLRVPPTTDPGVYKGKLLVRNAAQARAEFTCELRLRVLPVALPSARTLPVICRVDPRDLLATHLQWPRERAEQTRLLRDSSQHQAAIGLIDATMRLFQEHRTNPVLWASFPKFRPVGQRRMEIDWAPYDRLVEGWLSGDAFADLVALSHWPVPVSLEYPDAELEGGLTSSSYARVLSAYVAECRRHFSERGWLERAFVRLCGPTELTPTAVERVRRIGGILRGADVPLVAHLPARSLRGFGWRNAPAIDLPQVGIWAPPSAWYEPEAMRRERAQGRVTWLSPDHPPYSGTLAPAGLATDAQILGWQAYRYEIDALWIERAAEFGAQTASGASDAEWLIYPGSRYGLPDSPVPSIRLKRLRRGLQDHALLTLLDRRGKHLLASTLARQIVRWAGTDACLDHLLSCKPTGWPRDGRPLALGRELVLQELAGEFVPSSATRSTQVARLAEWGRMMNAATRVFVSVEGVRLRAVGDELRAGVLCAALNLTNAELSGRWVLPAPPVGWSQPNEPATTTLPPNTRRRTQLELVLSGAAYNTDGAYPFNLRFDTDTLGSFVVAARLAVAACPLLEQAPTIDGNLSDWPFASNNAAGDFRLVRGARADVPPEESDRPTLPTQAFFAADHDRLYVAVRCRLGDGERPIWRTDNRVPVDGAVPWGQDVVEIIIDPRGTPQGQPDDLYLLQIKPTGVAVTRKGCPTEPPIGESALWHARVTVAVRVQPDAWVIELSLPLASLGPDGVENRIWGLNVTRLDARRGEYSSWSGATDTCYSPQSLGNLILLRP